jgi:hypothetical protein
MPEKIRDKSGGIIYKPTTEDIEKQKLLSRIKKLESNIEKLLIWKESIDKEIFKNKNG